jgi:hypothetical protein
MFKIQSKYLDYLFIIIIFFPFISFYPIQTDIQPLVFLVAVFFVFPIRKIDVGDSLFFYGFIFFSFLSIFYFNFDSEFNFIKRFNILASLVLFLGMLKVFEKITPKLIFLISFSHFFFLCFQFLFPEVFSNLFGFSMGRITYTSLERIRGVHGLNSEPGGASAVLFLIIFMSLYFKRFKYVNQSKELVSINLSIFLGMVGLLLTKSGLGYLLFIVVLILLINKAHRKLALVSLFFVFVLLVSFVYSNDFYFRIRGLDLLIYGIKNPSTIFYIDGSVAERFLGLSYGLHSLLHFPFGLGGGSYPIAAQKMENIYNLSSIYFSARSQINGTVSSLGIYLAEYGLFFLFFLIALGYKIFSFNFLSVIGTFFVFAFITFSFSIAFPVTWLLIIVLIKIKKYDKNSLC